MTSKLARGKKGASVSVHGDKAGLDYWNALWRVRTLPNPIDPSEPGYANYVNRKFHEFFESHLSAIPPGASFLEVGCARSVWLPYFASEFKFNVAGIDYSELGCEQERAILSLAGLEGKIVCADLFNPPPWTVGSFDIVCTFGVVEHFQNTRECIRAIGRYLKPGGIAITIVPNMCGAVGWFTRLLNRPIFDIHVQLSSDSLASAHLDTDLVVQECRYFLSTNFGVVNLNAQRRGETLFLMKRLLQKGLNTFSLLTWTAEGFLAPFPVTRSLSPYIVCVAKKVEGLADGS
jgi:SAM-dependent methyltransferase